MSAPKSNVEAFTQNWNKSVAWAQTQGISASSYIPVYQMDSQRLASGYSPMSAAERNIGILAAANPNNVPSAPSDNPRPSNVFGNARHDLASIVTGLEPSHLISGLFDTVKNTVEDLAHPSRLEGKNFEATLGNWFQNTLLSFVPGVYDLGSFMSADAKAGTAAGFAALADHPLLSLLDLMPADEGVGSLLAKTGLGLGAAKMAGVDLTEGTAAHALLANGSVVKSLTTALGNQTWFLKDKPGINPADASQGILEQQNISMKLQEWLGKTAQTSGPIQNLAKFFFTKNQMKTGLFHNNLQSLVDSLSQLSPDEVDGYDEIWRLHNTEGKNLEDILADPKYTEKTRAAVKETANGARRYLVNEHIVMNDVTGVRGLDGKIHIYTSKGAVADIVLAARDRLRKATRDFGNALDASDRLKRWLDRVDANTGRMAQQLKQGLDQARQAVKTAEDRTENIKQVTTDEKGKEHVSTFGKKGEAYDRLVAPGGLIEQVVQAMEEGRMDEAMTLLKPLRDRLSEWGDKSVDATEAQAFQGIAAQLDSLDKLMERRKKVDTELHNRIVGEEEITTRLKNEDVVRRRAEKKEMQDRHVQERKDLRAQKKLAKGRVKQARDKRMADLDAAYQRNVDVLYTRADQAAERATKAQADAIYKQTKREHNAMRSVWFEAKNRENLKYDKMELAGELDVAKEEPKLMKRQQREADELAKNQKWWELFHGSMAEEMKNYNDTLDEFKKAVEDNPTDNYQPMELALFMQHLMDHEKSARLIDETEQKLTKDWDESRLDALHKNPDLLKEQVWLYARDVYLHPDNYEPDLVNFTNQVMNDVIDSGTKELKVLIAQGYDPLWLPRADVNDRQKSAIHVEVGKGTPHIDAAHERIHDLAPTRHDTFLGVSKDMAQALSRDAHIEMVVDYLMPLGITGKELEGQLHNIPGWEDIDVGKATSLAYDAVALKKLGLTRFDSEATFGFMPPTWAGEAVYLPTGLANGLQKMMDLEKSGDKGPFDKINQVFRYSILGLSPRYTAHILFGGTFLLALRSTPYMPLMIGKAFRSMKNGDNPEEIYRQPTQEGFSRMQQALTAHASASGQQLGLSRSRSTSRRPSTSCCPKLRAITTSRRLPTSTSSSPAG